MWVLPALLIVAGVVAALGLSEIDKAAGYDLIPASVVGTATTAQQVLSLLAQAVLNLATVVLSLTLVAVQLAMGQFSPRIVRALQADRRNQAAIGVFLGTFAYAMLAMRAVDAEDGKVPGLTVLVAYLLGLACLVGLLVYIHQVSQSLRVAGIIDLVGDETWAQLEQRFPPDADAPRPDDGAPGCPGRVRLHVRRRRTDRPRRAGRGRTRGRRVCRARPHDGRLHARRRPAGPDKRR